MIQNCRLFRLDEFESMCSFDHLAIAFWSVLIFTGINLLYLKYWLHEVFKWNLIVLYCLLELEHLDLLMLTPLLWILDNKRLLPLQWLLLILHIAVLIIGLAAMSCKVHLRFCRLLLFNVPKQGMEVANLYELAAWLTSFELDCRGHGWFVQRCRLCCDAVDLKVVLLQQGSLLAELMMHDLADLTTVPLHNVPSLVDIVVVLQ